MNAVIKRDNEVESIGVAKLGEIFAASGYFRDVRDQAQAVVKILYGRELGFSPVVSMMGIHVIEGKPSLSSNLLGTLVKRSGKYDYRVKVSTDTECVLEFLAGMKDARESLGTSSFTIEDAKRANLLKPNSGWLKYPKAMLFARALSAGIRLHCPDVSACPLYVPEELGATVDEEGAVTELPKSAKSAEVTTEDIEIKPPTDTSKINDKRNDISGPSTLAGAGVTADMLSSNGQPAQTADEYITTDDAQAIYMYAKSFLDKSLHKHCRGWVHEWCKAKGLIDVKGDGTLLKVRRYYVNSEGREVSGIEGAKKALEEVMKDRNAAAVTKTK